MTRQLPLVPSFILILSFISEQPGSQEYHLSPVAFYDILPAPFEVYTGCDYFNNQNMNFGLNITAAVVLDPATLHHLSSSLDCNLRQAVQRPSGHRM